MSQSAKRIIVIECDNNPGVLSRITGLFTRRGYNIESLVTGVTDNPKVYRIMVTLISTEEELELLVRQLEDLLEVINVYKGDHGCVKKELMLIKVKCPLEKRGELIQTVNNIGLTVAAIGGDSVIVQTVGDDVSLELALRSLEQYGIEQTIRTGSIVMNID